MTAQMVDRDGNPIEISHDLAGDVKQFPIPEGVPDRLIMKPARLGSSEDRRYHRPDADDPEVPGCSEGNRQRVTWRAVPSHAIPGNYPACEWCFPAVDGGGPER